MNRSGTPERACPVKSEWHSSCRRRGALCKQASGASASRNKDDMRYTIYQIIAIRGRLFRLGFSQISDPDLRASDPQGEPASGAEAHVQWRCMKWKTGHLSARCPK